MARGSSPGSVTSSMTFCLRSSKFNCSCPRVLRVNPRTLHSAFLSVILGASGSKLDDVIAGSQFTGEFAEMIARGRVGFARSMQEDDGVRVEVEDPFRGYFAESISVEFESCPAGGETGHEDVDVDLNGLFVVDLFVDKFDHLVVHDTKGLHDVRVVIQEFVESGGFRDGFDLTLVALLPVLAPETVEHNFGERPPTRIFLDVVGLKLDSFLVQVILNVLGPFVFIVIHPLGPSAGFFFHLEKGVDVGGEHGVGIGGKMPYFVHVSNDVTSIDGFLEFGGWARCQSDNVLLRCGHNDDYVLSRV